MNKYKYSEIYEHNDNNKILSEHLKTSEKIKTITTVVYVKGAAIAKLFNVKADATDRRKNPKGEKDRRERKLCDQIKSLRQRIARVNNEFHRRRTGSEATKKEFCTRIEKTHKKEN